MILYHYTCHDHGGPAIIAERVLRPAPQPWLSNARLAWLTDFDQPNRAGLGLTAAWLDCDRTTVRVRVDVDPDLDVETWTRWAHRHRIERVLRDTLECDGHPAHWWVSDQPLPILDVAAVTRTGVTR